MHNILPAQDEPLSVFPPALNHEYLSISSSLIFFTIPSARPSTCKNSNSLHTAPFSKELPHGKTNPFVFGFYDAFYCPVTAFISSSRYIPSSIPPQNKLYKISHGNFYQFLIHNILFLTLYTYYIINQKRREQSLPPFFPLLYNIFVSFSQTPHFFFCTFHCVENFVSLNSTRLR